MQSNLKQHNEPHAGFFCVCVCVGMCVRTLMGVCVCVCVSEDIGKPIDFELHYILFH